MDLIWFRNCGGARGGDKLGVSGKRKREEEEEEEEDHVHVPSLHFQFSSLSNTL